MTSLMECNRFLMMTIYAIFCNPDNDLTKYLADIKKVENNVSWLDKCKKHFCNVLTSRTEQPRGIGEFPAILRFLWIEYEC